METVTPVRDDSTRAPADASPFGFLVLRTPLLPFSELEAWGSGLAAPAAEEAGAGGEALAAAITADQETLRARLRELIARPEVAEALWVASPSLVAGLDEWRRDPDGKKGRRAEQALVRYLVRMTSRATPFGLFSGCSLGYVGERTELVLEPLAAYRRRTRLDTGYLLRLCDELGRDPELRSRLRYHPNSSLYRSGGRLRYAEGRLENGERSYHLVAIDPDVFVERALEGAGPGRTGRGATVAELAAELRAADPDGEVGAEEAADFAGELIDNQLLVSDLAPPVTTVDALGDVLGVLREHGAPARIEEPLAAAAAAIDGLDREGLGLGAGRYEAIAGGLAALPAEVDRARLFQVDMTKPATVTLGPAVVAELARGVRLLQRLARPKPAAADPLASFRDAFVERWGSDRAVPLTEALDEELGIGFQPALGRDASPLLAGVDLPARREEPAPPPSSRVDLVLSARLAEALAAGAAELELTEDALARIDAADPAGGSGQGAAAPALPDAFEVVAVLAAGSAEAADAGDFRLLIKGASGPSGARMTSRFCHADDELRRGVEELLAAEERLVPDAVFAEIVHLPQGRIGNVVSRPVLRGWEIEYLGRGGAPAERRLAATDLQVSVSGGRVLLRSERLGRRVIPRLTSAHDYTLRSQGLYRFLATLQHQDLQGGLSWSWGPLDAFPFLPRVRAGRVVLARARWRVDGAEVRALDRGDACERFRAVQQWRRRRALPRWVVLADGDNELTVDLDNPLALDAFFSLLGERERVELTELFPAPGELPVTGPEGAFVHELVVPLLRRREPSPAMSPPSATPAGPLHRNVCRSFAPGSEWLYAKIYTGSATADRVLAELVAGVVRPALASGAADGWFFLRFGDPHWHLRLRLHGDLCRLREEVEPALAAAVEPLLADGRVWKVQLDTYEREIERYAGPAGIALAERIFAADSDAAAELVERTPGDAGADARWRLALAGCARLLEDLGLDLEAQVGALERLAAGLAAEHTAGAPLRKRLAARLRAERASLEELLAADEGSGHPLAPGLAVLGRRSRALVPPVAELVRRAAAGRLTMPVAELAPSLLHMSVNRLIRSGARAHEMVIYDFLYRLLLARSRREASRDRRGGQVTNST